MKVAAVTTENGKTIADRVANGTEILIVTEAGGVPTARELVQIGDDGITSVLFKMAYQNIDVLLAGEIGTALQSTLRVLGVEMVPGCTGDAVENIAGYLMHEEIGDPSKIVEPEEDENDPMACLHDCAKCMANCIDRPKDIQVPRVQ